MCKANVLLGCAFTMHHNPLLCAGYWGRAVILTH